MTTATQTMPEISVIRQNLQRALSIVTRAVPSRATLPIIEGVECLTDQGRLRLRCTDLDVTITAWLGAMVLNEGAVVIPARRLSDIVGKMGDTLAVSPCGNRSIRIEGGHAKTEIQCFDAADFPQPQKTDFDISFEIPPKDLAKALQRAFSGVATDDSRPVLTSVNIKSDGKTITFAGADGFRLVVATVEHEAPEFEINLPQRAAREVARVCADAVEPVMVSLGKMRAQFTLTDVEIATTLNQGTFPNFRQLIPQDWNTRVTVDAKALMGLLEGAGVVAADGSGITRLFFTKDAERAIRVTAISAEHMDFEAETAGEMEGDSTRIAFNHRYVREAVDLFEGDVFIELTSPSAQGKFTNDRDLVVVCMPMFVND